MSGVVAFFRHVRCRSKIFESNILFSQWKTSGHIERAANMLKSWVESQNLPGAKIEVLESAATQD